MAPARIRARWLIVAALLVAGSIAAAQRPTPQAGSGWVCLDLKTGHKMWQERGVGKGSLCFADGMLYLFGERGGKAGLATCSPDGMQMTGSFAVQGDGPSWAHPVVTGGRLYLRYDTNLYCFNVKAG